MFVRSADSADEVGTKETSKIEKTRSSILERKWRQRGKREFIGGQSIGTIRRVTFAASGYSSLDLSSTWRLAFGSLRLTIE